MKCAENAAREALDVKLDDGDEDEKEEDDMCFTEADGNDHPLPHGVEARTLLTGASTIEPFLLNRPKSFLK